MPMRMKCTIAYVVAIFLLCSACEKDVVILREVEYISYTDQEFEELSQVLNLPRYVHNYNGDNHLASDTRATLGRVLFYDKNLSEDHQISCASCHQQQLAFSDDVALSEGIFGRRTERNTLALGVFTSFVDKYGSEGHPGEEALFWDTRTLDVHSQITETMANELEMGLTQEEAEARLRGEDHYQILFAKAFPNGSVTSEGMLMALERFMQGMTTSNSKFDRFREALVTNNDGTVVDNVFTDSERQGFILFKTHCQSCHANSVQTNFGVTGKTFANNGLDAATLDDGRRAVTSLEEDEAVFKVPSLRNVELTGPYMHDGRFASLSEVIDFYSEGIQPHRNLDPLLRDQDGNPLRLDFTEQEKKSLIDFLKALTDMSELSHEKFSDPWL